MGNFPESFGIFRISENGQNLTESLRFWIFVHPDDELPTPRRSGLSCWNLPNNSSARENHRQVIFSLLFYFPIVSYHVPRISTANMIASKCWSNNHLTQTQFPCTFIKKFFYPCLLFDFMFDLYPFCADQRQKTAWTESGNNCPNMAGVAGRWKGPIPAAGKTEPPSKLVQSNR